MGKTIYSDNTDINGVNYETIGENIRNGAKALTYESVKPVLVENKENLISELGLNGAKDLTYESIKPLLVENKENLLSELGINGEKDLTYESIKPVLVKNKANILQDLSANSIHFVKTVVALLTGVATNWGGEYVDVLTEQEKQRIKAYLGIN